MIKNSHIYIILALMVIVSCSKSDKNRDNEIHKSLDFGTTSNLRSETKEVSEVFDVKEWQNNDSVIICRSSNSDSVFYVLDIADLNVKSSFGVIGEAPNEYVAPHIAGIDNDTLLVLDNGKQQMLKVLGDSVVSNSKITITSPLNMTKLADNGNILSITLDNKVPCIGMMNPNLKTTETLLSLGDLDENISNISYDTFGNKTVITTLKTDKIIVFDLDSRTALRITGNQKASTYYSDVICGPKSFYLLSQKGYNRNTKEGNSVIEEYAYDGSPISCYNLDILASKFIFDNNRRFILRSPSDDDFHTVELKN